MVIKTATLKCYLFLCFNSKGRTTSITRKFFVWISINYLAGNLPKLMRKLTCYGRLFVKLGKLYNIVELGQLVKGLIQKRTIVGKTCFIVSPHLSVYFFVCMDFHQ